MKPSRSHAEESGDVNANAFKTSPSRAPSSRTVHGKQVVRVTGGEMRSRRLRFAAQPGLRPTPDRVRETLFNWLGQNLTGWRVLDMFAGSGILGIEALSRGAQWAGFIEQSNRVATEIRRSLNALAVAEDDAQVWSQDALCWLRQPPTQLMQVMQGGRIDLVFLDPPFARLDLLEQTVEQVQQADWLADEAYLYIEHSAQAASIQTEGWIKLREGRAGESAFALWRREMALPESE